MNRDDIVRMAREAGNVGGDHGVFFFYPDELERFAALVAAAERDRIADEAKHIIKRAEARGAAAAREACAQVADKWIGCDGLAAAIRARGEK